MADIVNIGNGSKYSVPPTGGSGGDGMDVKERIAKLETMLPTLATKSDIADLKSTIAEGRTDTIKTNTTVVVAGVSIIIAVVAFVSTVLFVTINRLAPTVTQFVPTPIVIQAQPQVSIPDPIKLPALTNVPATKP